MRPKGEESKLNAASFNQRTREPAKHFGRYISERMPVGYFLLASAIVAILIYAAVWSALF